MSGDAALPEGQPGGGGGVDDGGSSSGSVQTTRTPRSTLSHYPIVVDASIFTHTPFYCEENVYYLCKKLCEMGIADPKGVDLFVVFISNEEKMIPLWHQKASQRDDGLVVWDYHVICIQRRGGSVPDLVWDMDSSLPFPVPLTKYFAEAIRSMSALQFRNSRYCDHRLKIYHGSIYLNLNSRLFRVVHAPIFLRFFASDRSHMKDTQGKWIALPPKYEPIVAEDGTTNNIDKYIKMSSAEAVTRTQDFVQALFSNKYGVIVGEMQLQSFFSEIQQ